MLSSVRHDEGIGVQEAVHFYSECEVLVIVVLGGRTNKRDMFCTFAPQESNVLTIGDGAASGLAGSHPESAIYIKCRVAYQVQGQA